MTYQDSWTELAAMSRAGGQVVAPRRGAQAALALGAYILLAAVYVGHGALANPSGGTIGTGPDVQIFVWGLRWWPYSLLHGTNPLVSHVVWAPYGSHVLWTSTVPLLSLLVAPVTLTAGPTAAFNLLCVLAPALSAWGAFLLCRELTRSFWPSLAGGVIYGFSSYELAESIAHLQMTFTLLVPIAALLVVRFMRGRVSGPGLAIRAGLIVAAQFLVSPEILVTMLVTAAIATVAAAFLIPPSRGQVREAVKWTALGLAGAAVVTAPVLLAMLGTMPSATMNPPATYSADLANFLIPTRVTWLGGVWTAGLASHFPGNASEQVAYLGLPLVAILAAAIWAQRDRGGVRVLATVMASAALLSLGPRLEIDGHRTLWLPGAVLAHVPVLDDALPARFGLYTSLAAAVLVALWLAASRRPRPARWAAVGLAVLSLAPAMTLPLWWQATPPAIAHNDLGRLVPAGSTVISLPFWAVDERGLYAQAVAAMHFRLDDSWLQAVPRQYAPEVTSQTLAWRIGAAQVAAFERAVCRLGADYAVVWNDRPARSRMLGLLHLHPRAVDNLLIYRLPTSRYCPAHGLRPRPGGRARL